MKVEPGYYIKIMLSEEEVNILRKALDRIDYYNLLHDEINFIEKLQDKLSGE